MSIEKFIQAMPKVELHIQLEGVLQKDTLMLIAEQNDVPDHIKHFSQWIGLLDKPDYKRLDEMIRTYRQWLQQPEDLTRLVYELGVSLAKQQVRYAEVSVDPTPYIEAGSTFEQILAAINDGRDRAERGWGVRLAWILTIPRDQPRRADDIVRWASSASARKGGVVGIGLGRPEASQPVGQFERAFRTAEKKGLARVPHAGETLGAEGMLDAINNLAPNRILGGWGTADAPDVIQILLDQQIGLNVCMAGDLCMGRAESYKSYPLGYLVDAGVRVVLGADMPSFYKTSLTAEYLAAVEHCGLEIEELEDLALNAVRASLLSEDEKQAMLEIFVDDYARLRSELITEEKAK